MLQFDQASFCPATRYPAAALAPVAVEEALRRACLTDVVRSSNIGETGGSAMPGRRVVGGLPAAAAPSMTSR